MIFHVTATSISGHSPEKKPVDGARWIEERGPMKREGFWSISLSSIDDLTSLIKKETWSNLVLRPTEPYESDTKRYPYTIEIYDTWRE